MASVEFSKIGLESSRFSIDTSYMNSANTAAPKTAADLVADWKRVSRSLANELLSESDAAAIRRERDLIQAAIKKASK